MKGAFYWLRQHRQCLVRAAMFFVAAVLGGCATTNQGAFEKLILDQARIVDLTHPLKLGIPTGLEGEPFRIAPAQAPDSAEFYINRFSMAETTGTNIEAPARIVSSAPSVDQLPSGQLMGYGIVVDITKAVKDYPGYQVTKSDIEVWESDHGPVPAEAIVLIRTGWSERWSTPERYYNRDKDGNPQYPGISAEAVDFLIRERRVHALGIDTMSLYLGSGNAPGQRAFLLTGKYHINNLTNLDRLPTTGAVIIAIPLRIEGGTGAPARVLAIVPQEKTEVEPGKKKVEQGNDAGMQQGNPGMNY